MLIFLAFLPLVSCWGYLGHRTVAYLAQLHFTPEASLWVDSLLDGQDISEAAVWPDKVAHLKKYSYSKTWHYIDAQDDPPRVCGLNFTRDCLGSCVVSAIINQTERLQNETLSHYQRLEALKFTMHFFGDIHQPLHTENLDRGGNGIPVYFDDKLTNLHSVWDTLIAKKRINAKTTKLGARVYATKLFESGELNECVGDAKACALEWAAEANEFMCTYVLKDDIEGLPFDLGDAYYEGAIPIVDQQLQRAGRRLAAWINYMAPPLMQIQ